MKKSLFLLFFIFSFSLHGIAQTDSLGHPVFHSILLEVDTLKDCIVYIEYFTIRNNIDNSRSSVYIHANPSLVELINFACTQPSYYFVIITGSVISHTILMKPRIDNSHVVYSYSITNSKSGNEIERTSKTSGDITELRSAELILNAYDKGARAVQSDAEKFCFFEGKYYSIQSFQSVKKEVIDIIAKYKLSNPDIELNKYKEE
jgi:hypothetical protein